jgi:hypothetical protein
MSNDYNNKLLNKIKRFTEHQQQLFVASFYCYLKYSQTAIGRSGHGLNVVWEY